MRYSLSDILRFRTCTAETDHWRLLEPGMVMTVEPGIYVGAGIKVPKKYQGIGIRIEDRLGSRGQTEARHQVRHNAHAIAEDFLATGVAVRLVGQCHNRIGVGMVHEFMRQEGV